MGDHDERLIQDGNGIIIQAFMVNDLKLSGNELIVYAVIYSFSKDGVCWFTGSRRYLAAWCQTSVKTVSNNLKKLMAKGLLRMRQRCDRHGKVNDYQAVVPLGVASGLAWGEESSQGVGKKVPLPREESSHHNKEINIEGKQSNKKERESFDSIIAERTDNHELVVALGEFIRMRERIKKPLTNYALRLRLNKLWNLGKTDGERIAIVNQSVGACWQDFFALRESGPYVGRAQQATLDEYKSDNWEKM